MADIAVVSRECASPRLKAVLAVCLELSVNEVRDFSQISAKRCFLPIRDLAYWIREQRSYLLIINATVVFKERYFLSLLSPTGRKIHVSRETPTWLAKNSVYIYLWVCGRMSCARACACMWARVRTCVRGRAWATSLSRVAELVLKKADELLKTRDYQTYLPRSTGLTVTNRKIKFHYRSFILFPECLKQFSCNKL